MVGAAAGVAATGNIDFTGQVTDGDTVTILGDGSTAVLTIEESDVLVSGVAIMDGRRGVVARGGSVELDDVILQNNSGATLGGGLAVLDGAPDANDSFGV